MIRIRRSNDRGYAHYGWLESHYCFSFASYFSPDFMGHSSLRACNEDQLHPGASLDPTQFQQMEVFSLILEGQASFRDSLGRKGQLSAPGGAQLLSAANEIDYHLTNTASSKTLRMLQLWLKPGGDQSISTELQQTKLPPANGIQLVASGNNRSAAMQLQQDVDIYRLKLGKTACGLPGCQQGFLHVIKGELEINGTLLYPGDCALINDEAMLSIRTAPRTEALYLTLP